ncbi:MAG: undecaprenyl-phosphate glucose phosphotransferase [Phototrophicales bacterium]|nr:MAG: undecaprenyl-phosphate glucose phosphotransferase [Phototrophicales bacterium]
MDGDTPALDTLTVRKAQESSRYAHRILATILVTADIAMLVAAFALGYWARGVLPLFAIPAHPPPFIDYLPTMLLHVATIITLFYLTRLYHQRRGISRFDQLRDVISAVTIGAVLASGMQELFFKNTSFDVDYPRGMFFYVWVFSMTLMVVWREWHQVLRLRLRARGIDNVNLLLVGNGDIARDIIKKVRSRPELGYNMVGVVKGNEKRGSTMLNIPIVGVFQDIPHLIDALAVEQVIIALPESNRGELVDLITLCQRGQVDIKVFPDIFAYMAGDLNVDDLGGTPLLTVRDIALRGWRLSLKRGLDLFGAVVGLIFLSPLMLLTALLIKLESEGPVFYAQERMGLDGKPFPMIKFRSMRQDAEAAGPGWTTEDDPRVTRVGRFIRRTSWDEMPQLINVLLGHMSLVGPRPERPMYVRQFRNQIPRYMERHREKAGMTGWAQVNGLRGDTSISDRTSYDLWYVENWSLWLDIKIIIRTIIRIVLRRDENAY